MTILAILQARMTSTRLPNKVLAPILGQPVLARQIERLRRATTLDKLVVATSDDASDDPLAAMCEDIGVPFYRGSLSDVLGCFKGACEAFGSANHIVRLTGDCPLADPAVIDAVVRHHLASGADYTSNALQPSWPDGLDVEVMRMETLQRIFDEAHLPSEREHVTSYIYKNPEFFYIEQFKSERDLSHFRWTVDESADLVFVSEVYAALYPKNPAFDTTDILTLIEQCPELAKLNDNFLRNEGYAKSLAADTLNIPSN